MRKIYCDVCKKSMPVERKVWIRIDHHKDFNPVWNGDLCPKCYNKLKKEFEKLIERLTK